MNAVEFSYICSFLILNSTESSSQLTSWNTSRIKSKRLSCVLQPVILDLEREFAANLVQTWLQLFPYLVLIQDFFFFFFFDKLFL